MKAVGEITNVNIRVGPTVHLDGKYEVAVNGVSVDRKTMVIKCLSPEGKFTFEHAAAIREYMTNLGFSYDWESKRKELRMKKKLPHPSECKTDQEHMAAVVLGLSQTEHYKFTDVSVSQEDLEPGKVRLTGTCIREDINPNDPAI